MADPKTRPEVTREEYWWGYVLHNKRGCIVLTKRSINEGLPIECKQLADGRFELTILWPDEEAERCRAREAYERALAKERKALDCLPQSHEHYRSTCSQQAVRMMELIKNVYCATPLGGYVYAPEVLDELELKIQELRELLLNGWTLFLPEVRKARIAEIKAKTAAADPQLRALLDSLVRPES
jgi:hypothetical protein